MIRKSDRLVATLEMILAAFFLLPFHSSQQPVMHQPPLELIMHRSPSSYYSLVSRIIVAALIRHYISVTSTL